MSGPLAIASVTSALKSLLDTGLTSFDLSGIGSFSVTTLPPDRVDTGATEPNQLNLFLYQVTPNLGWRNAGLPTADGNGGRTGNAPLAIDLHYLLTAYGAKDTYAVVLLGFAMYLFHQNPVLTRAFLRSVLSPSPWGPALPADDLAAQVERIKITPAYLGTEDLSKMWTAMQARYRTTMAYMASVVLIQPGPGGNAAPPVLKQGAADRGPVAVGSPGPSLTRARSAVSDSLPGVRLGEDVVLTGAHLGDPPVTTARFEHAQTRIVTTAPVTVGPAPSTLVAHLPSIGEDADAMHEWAPGLYTVSLHTILPDVPAWATNAVPVALSPIVDVSPLDAAVGDFTLTLHCTPRIRPEQEPLVTLIFGSRQVLPATITSPPDEQQPTELTFDLEDVPAGEYLVRLRVNGIDSLPVTVTGTPPQFAFDPSQKVTVT
jgi:hypothetical protein